jgi:Phosphopantetheine attachment site
MPQQTLQRAECMHGPFTIVPHEERSLNCRLGASGDGEFSGLDSLSSMALSTNLGNALGLQLAMTLAYDYPSVRALAEHLHGILTPLEAVALDRRKLSAAAIRPTREHTLRASFFEVSAPLRRPLSGTDDADS